MGAIVVTLFAEKGGAGRTTTTLNFLAFLAQEGYRVLAVDTDKQGNLSKTFFSEVYVEELHKLNTVAAIFDPTLDPEPEHVIQPTNIERLFIAPANRFLKEHIQPDSQTMRTAQWALRQFIGDVSDAFDFVLIDTPPDIDSLTAWGSLLAAHFVVTPVEMERYSGQSLNGTRLQFQAAQEVRNDDLKFLGYIVTKRMRRVIHQKFEKNLRNMHGPIVFDTVMRNLAAFPEAQALGKTVLDYDPKSDAAELTRTLGRELLARIEQAGTPINPDGKRRVA